MEKEEKKEGRQEIRKLTGYKRRTLNRQPHGKCFDERKWVYAAELWEKRQLREKPSIWRWYKKERVNHRSLCWIMLHTDQKEDCSRLA